MIRLALAAALAVPAWGQPAGLKLPPGFQLQIYADVPGARELTVGEDGTVYVGTAESRVYALPDRDRNGKADEVVVLAQGLNGPNGVAVQGKDLYVGEVHQLLRYRNVAAHLKNPPRPEVLCAYPKDRWHGYRVLRFGPDGRLYFAVGAPSNADVPRPGYATLNRMAADYRSYTVYAEGIRNTVGWDWHPLSKELWFTDNGRDLMGDDIPPDELNCAPKAGLHFGFPYRWGNNQPDPALGSQAPTGKSFTPPRCAFPAHVASLGLRFYNGSQFPGEYRNAAFVAWHGSWNRSVPQGYQVVSVTVKADGSAAYKPFLTGFLNSKSGQVSGRPVDVLPMTDGSLLISDDHGGKVYRVRYAK